MTERARLALLGRYDIVALSQHDIVALCRVDISGTFRREDSHEVELPGPLE